jgi:hypothetical protein
MLASNASKRESTDPQFHYQTQISDGRPRNKHAQRQIEHRDALPAASTFAVSPSRAPSSLPNEDESMTAQDASPIINLPTVPDRPVDSGNRLNSKGSISMPTHPTVPPFSGSETSGLERLDSTRPPGSVSSGIASGRKLDGVELTVDDIRELFDE